MPTLSWMNREEAVRGAMRAPFRLLEHDPTLSYGDPDNENMLIHGDNLESAKAMLPFFAGRVKCLAIDPPYNTRSAFEHYDDNLEHSTWLSMMYPRLEIMRDLLAEDGSIWVCIDDNETHTPFKSKKKSPLLGIHKGTAIYLLYNGILGDRSVDGGNVLNAATFKLLPAHDGPKVIYGEWSQWGAERLQRENIIFKMVPYEVKVR